MIERTDEREEAMMYGYQRNGHDSHKHEFLSGMFLGVAMGAAIGLLFAPWSGAETRGRVADSADRLRKQAGKTYDRASSMMHDAVDRGKHAWQRGQESFEETRDSIAREAERVGDRVSQVI